MINLRKICSRWVPHGLTEDQRPSRVRCSKQESPILEPNRKYDVVTGSKFYTSISYDDRKRKEQNKECLEKEAAHPWLSGTEEHQEPYV